MDERILVSQAVTGDKEAFAGLYTLYKDSLYRYAFFKLGDPQYAQDAVSACIVSAYEGIGGLRSAGAFRAWIFRILHRCCLKLIEEKAAQNNRADVSELDSMEAEQGGISLDIAEALNVLTPEDRDIVLLAVVAGYNSSEIADLIGLKPATVRSRLARGLKKMRDFLE